MISLPAGVAANNAVPALLDFGAHLRPASGAAVQRLERKGSRYRLQVSLPPMQPDLAEQVVSRLLRAKSEGLRIAYPLLRSQGSPGSPVVNGAGQSGTTLAIRGLTPGYQFKEGYWLSIIDAAGQYYLHNCGTALTVGVGGTALITITPELRVPFADGALIELAAPKVEGLIEGDAFSWQVPVDRRIAVEFPLEEAA